MRIKSAGKWKEESVLANEALREQNTHRVLEEAIVRFQEYGVEETKIPEVAKRAGVNQRSIYRYFGSKDSLVLQAVYHLQMGKPDFPLNRQRRKPSL